MSILAPAPPLPVAPPPASPDVPTMPIYRLSVAQYEAMIRHGIVTPRDRIELIRGWLVPKMTKNQPHAVACGLLMDVLQVLLPAGWHLRLQDPTRLDDSVPEPDGLVARGTRREFDEQRGHPTGADTGLVIEVSESSLSYDRTIKRPLYAEARIPIFWIVNLVDRLIEVYTDPTGHVGQSDYASRRDYPVGAEVPLVLDGVEVARIPVQDLLP